MTEKQLPKAFEAFTRELRTFSSKAVDTFAKYSTGNPKTIQGDYIVPIVAGDWKAIIKLSDKKLNSVADLFREMSKTQARLKDLADEREAVVAELKTVYKPPRRRKDWGEL